VSTKVQFAFESDRQVQVAAHFTNLRVNALSMSQFGEALGLRAAAGLPPDIGHLTGSLILYLDLSQKGKVTVTPLEVERTEGLDQGSEDEQRVPQVSQLGAVVRTEREFELIEFFDRYDKRCSLQASSLAEHEQPGTSAVWLGLNEPHLPHLGHSTSPRMHLDVERVRSLVAHLQAWLDRGTFELEKAPAMKAGKPDFVDEDPLPPDWPPPIVGPGGPTDPPAGGGG